MARITPSQINSTLGVENSYDILNAIRNSASESYKQYVPLANKENVAEVGAGIRSTQVILNEFINSLVDRIGLTIVRRVTLNNQLKKFKQGMLPLGRTVQEIFTDIAQEKLYDPEEAEETVFKREIPNVKTLYHELNRKGYFKQTIQDESLRSAFVSWGNFDSFLSGIINAIYNSEEYAEYGYMKLILENYDAKGLYYEIQSEPVVSESSAKQFIKQIRATAREISLGNGTRKFNAMGVHTRSDMDDLHIFMTPQLEAEVDVDVLAVAFNMSKADFLGNVTIVDNFGNPDIMAIMVDRDFFQVYDQVVNMETIRNPQGLYWTYFFHKWQVLSASQFSNAVVFKTNGVKAVTQVNVDPMVASLKAGKGMPLNAFVRKSNIADRDYVVTWSIDEEKTNTPIADGTKVTVDSDNNKVARLEFGQEQVGTVFVKASVNIGTDDEAELVNGETSVTAY